MLQSRRGTSKTWWSRQSKPKGMSQGEQANGNRKQQLLLPPHADEA